VRRGLLIAVVLAVLTAAALQAADQAPPPRRDAVERAALAPPRLRTNPEPIAAEFQPAPFPPRDIRLPEPGEAPPSETAAFCDEGNWSRLDLDATPTGGGAFRVDAAAWDRALSGTRAGLASFLSLCRADGGTDTLVAARTDETLATYDPEAGLRIAPR